MSPLTSCSGSFFCMSELRTQLEKRKDKVLDPSSSHKRASLLFAKKDAQNIELQALHTLAMSGVDQLKKQEPRIKPFEATLFSEASQELVREQQSAEANKRLDESLETLFAVLAPHFLLKSTHKMLEYLIRKYRYVPHLPVRLTDSLASISTIEMHYYATFCHTIRPIRL